MPAEWKQGQLNETDVYGRDVVCLLGVAAVNIKLLQKSTTLLPPWHHILLPDLHGMAYTVPATITLYWAEAPAWSSTYVDLTRVVCYGHSYFSDSRPFLSLSDPLPWPQIPPTIQEWGNLLAICTSFWVMNSVHSWFLVLGTLVIPTVKGFDHHSGL